MQPIKLSDHKLEKDLFTSLLLSPSCMVEVASVLLPSHFDKFEYRELYRAALVVWESSARLDITGIMPVLRRNVQMTTFDLGTIADLESNRFPRFSTENIRSHAKELIDLYKRRKSDQLGRKMQEYSRKPNVDVLEYAMGEIEKIADSGKEGKTLHIGTFKNSILENARLAKERRGSGELTPGNLPFGLRPMDAHTGGCGGGQFVVLGAKTSEGKSTFARQWALNAARAGHPVFFGAHEQLGEQFTMMLACTEGGISMTNVTRGLSSDKELTQLERTLNHIDTYPIHVNDDCNDFQNFILNVKQWHMSHRDTDKVPLIITDYLQHMQGNSYRTTRERELASMSVKLKELSKKINAVVVAVVQRNANDEKRQDPRPKLGDSRECKAIEFEADKVIYMFRPYYHGQVQDETGLTTKYSCEMHFVKNRGGATGAVKVGCRMETGQFLDSVPVTDYAGLNDLNGYNGHHEPVLMGQTVELSTSVTDEPDEMPF